MSRAFGPWVALVVVAASVFVVCGGGDDDQAEPPTTRASSSSTLSSSSTESSAPGSSTTVEPAEDIEMRPEDFPNIRSMTKVRSFYVGNLLGHVDESLAVARNEDGGTYPVGTLLQLVPQEAMVKRAKGWSPATNDWEFFFLDVSEQGTEIVTRGAAKTVNRFGGNCASCHLEAEPQFDMVCEKTHGCVELPLTDELITAIQEGDPRPMP